MSTRGAYRPVDDALRLLCQCCAHVLGHDRTQELERLSARADWQQVLRLQTRHGLQSLVWTVHRQAPFLPSDLDDAFERSHRQTVVRSLGQLGAIKRILGETSRRSLTVLVLKGPVVSQDLFGSPTFRWARDVDILCRPDDLGHARAALESLGYRRKVKGRDWHDVYIDQHGRVLVELHTRLFENRILAREGPPGDLPDARQVECDGFEVPTLARTDQLAYLLTHGAQHAWGRMKWLLDAAAMLGRAGAPGAARATAPPGLAALERDARQLAGELFDVWSLEPNAGASDDRAGRRRVWLARRCLEAADHVSPVSRVRALLYRLQMKSGWRYRASVVQDAIDARLRPAARRPGRDE